eukprot:GHRR01033152.1.p1 GENE.GHRR01033152.1~~GHRR01033152.1.p1  ORF type:complete len:157 (+),score=33.55 GHRR01033152.1:132-602(+)
MLQYVVLQDFVEAVAEVDAGYITDEMVRERRGLQASILRRLEVEEWDKERMRHFYYGLYGLGPWYWDMEERLHNPFFIGARGWNGPPESWINENQVGRGHQNMQARDCQYTLSCCEGVATSWAVQQWPQLCCSTLFALGLGTAVDHHNLGRKNQNR